MAGVFQYVLRPSNPVALLMFFPHPSVLLLCTSWPLRVPVPEISISTLCSCSSPGSECRAEIGQGFWSPVKTPIQLWSQDGFAKNWNFVSVWGHLQSLSARLRKGTPGFGGQKLAGSPLHLQAPAFGWVDAPLGPVVQPACWAAEQCCGVW